MLFSDIRALNATGEPFSDTSSASTKKDKYNFLLSVYRIFIVPQFFMRPSFSKNDISFLAKKLQVI